MGGGAQPDAEALIEACSTGDAGAVRAILDADPSLAARANRFGVRPIHAAYFGNHGAIAGLLFDRGVERDVWLAAELNDMYLLTRLLREDPRLVGAYRADGNTPLHAACYWGQVDAARCLVEHGADVNAVTRDEFLLVQPLGAAVASPNIPNPSDDEDTVLVLARLLLDNGANVNARRGDGLTALHTAAFRGLLQVTRLLLARGADPLVEGTAGLHKGQLPYHVALMRNELQVARALKDAADAD